MSWSPPYLIKAIFVKIVLEKEVNTVLSYKSGKLYFANTLTISDVSSLKGVLFHRNSLQNIRFV